MPNFCLCKSLNLRLMLLCIALWWSINLFLYLELKNKKHYLCNRKRGKRLLRRNWRLEYLCWGDLGGYTKSDH